MVGAGVALLLEATFPSTLPDGLFGSATSGGAAQFAALVAALVCCSGARQAQSPGKAGWQQPRGCRPVVRLLTPQFPAVILGSAYTQTCIHCPSPPAAALAARLQRPFSSRRLLEPIIASLTSKRRSFSGVTQTNGGCSGRRSAGLALAAA